MNNGTVRYDESNRKWHIECQPHVALRLKRVFPKIDKSQHGSFSLTDTVDNARDLEWFLDRYPMTIADSGRLEARSRAFAERASVVENLLSARIPPPTFDLAIPPRDYQRTATALLLARGGLLLADDVGLGKTAAAIAPFSDPRTLPALVVTLAHLPHQWEAEVNRFAPALNTHIISKGQPYDLTESRRRGGQLLLGNALPDVLIINYHKLSAWSEVLAPVCRSVIFDEAQELRRMESLKYSAARHIAENVQCRMGLSVGPDSAIELVGGPFSDGWVGSIESAWDLVRSLADPIMLPSVHECVTVGDMGIRSRGWSDGFYWKPVKTFIRHASARLRPPDNDDPRIRAKSPTNG